VARPLSVAEADLEFSLASHAEYVQRTRSKHGVTGQVWKVWSDMSTGVSGIHVSTMEWQGGFQSPHRVMEHAGRPAHKNLLDVSPGQQLCARDQRRFR